MAYTKLFNSIITSTIWSEDDKTRIVWISMLALADKNGEVQGSVPGLARIAGVGVEDCRNALNKFLSPDPDSRTKDDEGRRIEEIDGGWALLNHRKYREMASDADRATQAAIRQQRARDKKKRNPVTPESRGSHAPVTPESLQIPQAEADAKVDTNTNPLARPLHEAEEREGARERTPIEEIQKRINAMKPEWGKPAHWSYTEQYSLQGGTATQIGELTDEDWAMLKLYLNTNMPTGAAYWQPRSRSKFVETFADTFGHAVRWADKTGNTPKQSPSRKDGWK